jgi:O-methyltransferase
MSLINLPLSDWLDNVSLAALSSKETLLTTFDLARIVIERGIPGDFVECGVYGGAQCAVMARAIMGRIEIEDSRWKQGDKIPRQNRRVHLFDSFAGVPAAGPHDEGWTHEPGVSKCDLDSVKAHMREWGITDELLWYHPGLFEETLEWAHPSVVGIAILRIDCDLYESTRLCLKHLLPLVSPGGYVICDDFALPGSRKAVLESPIANEGPAYFQVQPR